MAARVTITLPEDVLGRLDTIAREEGLTRSEVLREAAADYLTGRSVLAEATTRNRAVDDGISWLKEIAAARPEKTDDDTLAILHELRGASEAAGNPLEPKERPAARRR